MNVDLDDAGIRRHRELLQPVVTRRVVALQHHRQSEPLGDVLDGRDQLQPGVQRVQRR